MVVIVCDEVWNSGMQRVELKTGSEGSEEKVQRWLVFRALAWTSQMSNH